MELFSLQKFVKAVQGFIQVLNYLVKHPIVAIIALIVYGFMQLVQALNQNEEATNTINRIMAPFKAFLDAIVNSIMQLVNWILKFVEVLINGLMKSLENLPIVGKYFKQMNAEAEN